MKTEVSLERQLLGGTVRQKSQSGFFNVNDLLLAGNRYRILNGLTQIKYESWYNSSSTKEFVTELKSQVGDVIESKRGNGGERWIHPFLFIDLALYIDPKLKIEVYKWLYDELLKYRNDSGDSYRKMCGALYANCKSKGKYHKGVMATAKMIQDACGVKDWNKANEEQLKLRDKIHENIALLADVLRDNNQAIRVGISKALNP